MSNMKLLQAFDFDEMLNDLRYNFVIGIHGIFEGRGWDVKTEFTELAPRDNETLTLGFFANRLHEPGANLRETLDLLLADGRVLGKVIEGEVQLRCELEFCIREPEN